METVSAICTPAGVGGIAVIRLSGENSLQIAKKMFRPLGKKCDFKPNMMYAGYIDGDGFSDFGLLVYFKAPKSFTGEDTVEFHCHGGVQISRGILQKTFSLGARSAEKGEFTKRAFINGKLSLSSAEGMIDMINAESLASLRAGNMLYGEKLSKDVMDLQNGLTLILAEISADTDYPEEDLDNLNAGKIVGSIREVGEKLSHLASTYSGGKRIKDGVTVAICGKPNAGKSSLLNSLLGYDKAIVSSHAGTTRDAVEGAIEIDGVKYCLYDTAGIRENADEIESIGIGRTEKIMRSADVIISVSDGSGFVALPDSGAEVIEVFNKCDTVKPEGRYDIATSAKTGEGIEGLKKLLAKKAVGELSLDKAFLIEQRHYSAILRAKQALDSAVSNSGIFTPDVLAVDIKEAWDCLGEITGETANENIINTVFEKFCVGK